MVSRVLAVVAVALTCPIVQAQVVLTEGTNLSVDVAGDGRIVTDLLGGIWIVPLTGGEAVPIDRGLEPAQRPRWSPDNKKIAFQVRTNGRDRLRVYDFATKLSSAVGDGAHHDQQPSWHPDGTRLGFASDRQATGSQVG